jgi:hypothetical protein
MRTQKSLNLCGSLHQRHGGWQRLYAADLGEPVYFSAKDAKDAKFGGAFFLTAFNGSHFGKSAVSNWINHLVNLRSQNDQTVMTL